jgi:hypothetical protein
MRQWSSWCTAIYPTRVDLPIMPRSTLSTLALRKDDAVTDAKQSIDQLLAHVKYRRGTSMSDHAFCMSGSASYSP